MFNIGQNVFVSKINIEEKKRRKQLKKQKKLEEIARVEPIVELTSTFSLDDYPKSKKLNMKKLKL